MTSVLYLLLLPAKIVLYIAGFAVLVVPASLNMGSLLDALFRGLTGSDKVSQVEEGEKEAPANMDKAEPGVDKAQLGKQRPTNLVNPSDDPLDTHDPEAHTPILMSPIRRSSASDSLRTLTTLSTLDTSVSLSTPGADISLGPQAIPFALRRRLTLPQAESPFRNPQNIPNSNTLPNTQRTVRIQIRHPDETIEEAEPVAARPEGPVSEWRKEQVKYMRKGRVSTDLENKRIPTLNGPLSLPYARNPSGVDATVPDDTAYLGHLFGLKRADHVKIYPNETFQVTADGHTKATPEYAVATGDEPNRVHATRPLVVREPHQATGFRKGIDIVRPRSKAIEIKSPLLENAELATPVLNPSAPANSPNISTASAILRAQGAAAANGLEISRLGPAFDYSSPARDPFNVLIDQALANATRHRSTTTNAPRDEGPTVGPEGQAGVPNRGNYVDLMSLWHASNSLHAQPSENPTQSQPRRSVSDTPLSSTAGTFATAPFSTPVRIAPPAASSESKADKSENWRQKASRTPGGTEIPPIRSLTLIDGAHDGSAVMTIDALFEKFNRDEENKENTPPVRDSKVANSESDPASKETSSLPVKNARSAKTPTRSVLGESRGVSANSRVPKKGALPSAKGTPGAGKLLKKQVQGGSAEVEYKSKGKGGSLEG